MPTRAVRMFSNGIVSDVNSLNMGRRKFTLLYSNPNVYLVRNFVNENELKLIDKEGAEKLQAWEACMKRKRKKFEGSGVAIPRDYSAELKY